MGLARNLVFRQYWRKHIHRVRLDGYRGALAVVRYVEHVEELLPGKVAREGLQGLVAMHKDNGIIMIQEVLGTRRAARASAEVIYEAHRIVLQWDSGAARLCERDGLEIRSGSGQFINGGLMRGFGLSSGKGLGLASTYRDEHNAVLELIVSLAELLEQRPIILEVCGRQMCIVEVLPVRHDAVFLSYAC